MNYVSECSLIVKCVYTHIICRRWRRHAIFSVEDMSVIYVCLLFGFQRMFFSWAQRIPRAQSSMQYLPLPGTVAKIGIVVATITDCMTRFQQQPALSLSDSFSFFHLATSLKVQLCVCTAWQTLGEYFWVLTLIEMDPIINGCPSRDAFPTHDLAQ